MDGPTEPPEIVGSKSTAITYSLRIRGAPPPTPGQIVAVAVALREWVTMDHEARIARIQERVNAAVRRLEGVPGIMATSAPNGQFGTPNLRIEVKAGGRMSAEQLAGELERGTPSIVCAHDATSLRFYLGTIYDGDELVVADRVQEVLSR